VNGQSGEQGTGNSGEGDGSRETGTSESQISELASPHAGFPLPLCIANSQSFVLVTKQLRWGSRSSAHPTARISTRRLPASPLHCKLTEFCFCDKAVAVGLAELGPPYGFSLPASRFHIPNASRDRQSFSRSCRSDGSCGWQRGLAVRERSARIISAKRAGSKVRKQ